MRFAFQKCLATFPESIFYFSCYFLCIKLKGVFFMDFKDIKDAKSWSFNDIDNSIITREKEIKNLDAEVRKLREIKWQKISVEVMPLVLDGKIDVSVNDIQQLLLSKKTNDTEVEAKTVKQKKKSFRAKKSADDASEKNDDKDEDDDSIDVPEKSSAEIATALKTVAEEENENATTENSQPDVTETSAEVVENKTPQLGEEKIAPKNVEKKNLSTQNATSNTDALSNPAVEEFFEDVAPAVQPKKLTLDELQAIARYVGLPEDANFAEVRQAFELSKNALPQVVANNFEETLGKIERGEIA